MTQSLEELEKFSIPRTASFWGDDDTGACIHVAKSRNSATVYLFGAQPIMWQPDEQADVLWISDAAEFDLHTPIRGGIPVCWPWFGSHPAHPEWPSHGIARTATWTLDAIERIETDVVLRLSLPVRESDAKFWPHLSRPTITYTVGDTFCIELATTNIDPHPICFSQALHTYFSVSDIESIRIDGLEKAPFTDKLTGRKEPPADAPITIAAETDRIYHRPQEPIRLHDPGFSRTITIAHKGATSAVVWNPWSEKSASMGDMGEPDAYRGMVCIETGNVPPDDVILAPGETHTITTSISVAVAAE